MSTTPTGVPIFECSTCGITHPDGRKHCVECSRPTLYISPLTGLCLSCIRSER